jgi:hypothetical protein
MPYTTPASTLAQLKLLNPADAIRVLRQYTEQELSESYGMTTILKGLDEVEADYFPEAQMPAFTSSDGRFEVYSRRVGA